MSSNTVDYFIIKPKKGVALISIIKTLTLHFDLSQPSSHFHLAIPLKSSRCLKPSFIAALYRACACMIIWGVLHVTSSMMLHRASLTQGSIPSLCSLDTR